MLKQSQVNCSPLTAVLKCEHHELQAAEFFLTHPRRPRGSDGWRGLVGWVFIVSNLHFVSELVQCVCLDINFNVREVQNVVIVRFC